MRDPRWECSCGAPGDLQPLASPLAPWSPIEGWVTAPDCAPPLLFFWLLDKRQFCLTSCLRTSGLQAEIKEGTHSAGGPQGLWGTPGLS